MSFIDASERRRFSPDKMQKVNLFETAQMFCDIYCLEPGQAQKPHVHGGATKFYFVLEGTARVTIGEQERDLEPGALAWAEDGQNHGVKNSTESRLVMLVAMAPNPNV